MLKCLKEYKSKYSEFEKATKNSAKKFQIIKKESTQLGTQIAQLEKQKKQLSSRLGFKDNEEANSQIVALEKAWEEDKAKLTE